MSTTPALRGKKLGLPAASALVVGSVIGTGVFGLPSALAAFGPISIIAFILATIGALALAVVFGQLTKRVPGSGGPYLYARDAFGEFAGFLNAWSYWLTAWAGNAAIVVALTGYVEVFINTDHNVVWSIVIAVVCLWIPVLINVLGLRSMGGAQVVFTVLKIVPLALIAILGLFFLNPANFGPFNSSGTDAWTALAGAGAVALFAYLGIETASVAAGRVRDPEKNVPRATIYGTLACGLVYILGTVALFGTVSNADLRTSTAPFSDAANAIFSGAWAGQTIAVVAVISGLGCLVGWTFIVGEMPHAAAQDGMFPRVFAKEHRGMPLVGIIASTVLATLLTILAYTSFEQVFTMVVLLTVFTAVIPYLFSAASQIYWVVTRTRAVSWSHLARDVTVGVLALVFSFWALIGTGAEATFYGAIAFLLGVPLYVWMKASNRRRGIPSPTPWDASTVPDTPAALITASEPVGEPTPAGKGARS
ncbi:arginine/ornithine antiporter [Leifsonia xyli subsp. cynodontis DSM 46306]|uniref:Amino acid permease n=1 Tax=Leifsonia xyli subsp. cynodontis DSM 46306 TaxID=1389489 RepID=U3P446_LEIXC|nr:amino acid permease [Leifsonia xyli]AGW41085.1 arginine/ornithine antiporter [Leifsonia xyli subsp. cynodontis DSM 46306]